MHISNCCKNICHNFNWRNTVARLSSYTKYVELHKQFVVSAENVSIYFHTWYLNMEKPLTNVFLMLQESEWYSYRQLFYSFCIEISQKMDCFSYKIATQVLVLQKQHINKKLSFVVFLKLIQGFLNS